MPKLQYRSYPDSATVGEKKAEAFYQSDTLGKFHLASCARCFGQCYAEYVPCVISMSLMAELCTQTSTLKDILEHDTMAATNTLTKLRGYVNSEHLKHFI
jgi:hypothetical protein